MKFGTSGLRGLVSEMTDAACAAYVTAFLRHLGAMTTADGVLVGRDLRPSSPRIAAACLEAIRAAGLAALDCGVVPTPALALEAARRGVPAVMVTGSHIPFDRNGLKFYRREGEISKEDEAGIVAALAGSHPPAHSRGAIVAATGVGDRYVARTVDFFGGGALSGLRIGLYEHSAAGRELTAAALEALGAEVLSLGRTDDFVPIDTEAISVADAARIGDWVATHRLDALVSTDGDGDRPLLADETGAVVRGDTLGALAGRRVGADGVATPLNSSTALERSGWFPRVLRTRIGSPFVIEGIEALRAAGARLPVGYEANGGFLLGGTAEGPGGRRLPALPTRDALLPLAAVLAGAAREGRPISALVSDLPARVTASDRLQEVDPGRSGALLADLAGDMGFRADLVAGLDAGEVRELDTSDGVRMTLASGEILHLRMSGNAPELRCYCEAADEPRATRLMARALARVAGLLEAGGPARRAAGRPS